LAAVDFDRELMCGTSEVDDINPDRMLAAKSNGRKALP